jgi:hypothetical protein
MASGSFKYKNKNNKKARPVWIYTQSNITSIIKNNMNQRMFSLCKNQTFCHFFIGALVGK